MLQALEDMKADAEVMLAKFKAGAMDAEDDLIALIRKMENFISFHKAATADAAGPEFTDVSEIEVEDDKPAGYPPITPS